MKIDSSVAAIVTGGASGLGAATARAITQAGGNVVIADVNADAGNALAKELGQARFKGFDLLLQLWQALQLCQAAVVL